MRNRTTDHHTESGVGRGRRTSAVLSQVKSGRRKLVKQQAGQPSHDPHCPQAPGGHVGTKHIGLRQFVPKPTTFEADRRPVTAQGIAYRTHRYARKTSDWNGGLAGTGGLPQRLAGTPMHEHTAQNRKHSPDRGVQRNNALNQACMKLAPNPPQTCKLQPWRGYCGTKILRNFLPRGVG